MMHLQSLKLAHQLDEGSLVQKYRKKKKEGLNILDVIISCLSLPSQPNPLFLYDVVTYIIIVKAQVQLSKMGLFD